MRIVYMGTPQFAVSPLRALAAAGYEIAGVVTRTDKPAGRGRSLTAPPVKYAAMEMRLPVFQPKRVRDTAFIDQLKSIGPEVVIVAAYGQILPREILVLPQFGCINIHASLLPSFRGAAPVNWAIIKGEMETGITIMQMDEGMDTGAILLQEKIAIDPADTAGSLTERLSAVGANLITKALPLIADGRLLPLPQEASHATLAPLLKKDDGLIDWRIPAVDINNHIRGLSPWPGAHTFMDGKTIKIIAAEAVSGTGEPGLLYEKEEQVLEIGTGKGLLRIVRLQPEGKRPMSAGEYLRGHHGLVGKRFSVSPRSILNSEQ